jgi:8-amino-7-oxononanoate synthase
LDDLRQAGLLRSLRPPSGIDLSSNDYLGLSRHPLLIERMVEALAREGCGSTGSRLLRGERAAFANIERRFARFKGAGRALYFSSGYLANLAVLTAFAEPGDVIFSDQYNHASLIDGTRLSPARRVIFPHANAAALARMVREEPCEGQRFIVTESLFSMEGDFAPLADYAALCRQTGAVLMVDEAHAVGIYGERGTGLIEATGADAFLSVNAAGKALGVAGAFVAGPEWAVELLIQRARPFLFSTAPPPALAAALDASLDLIEREPDRRARVLSNARELRARLRAAGVPVGEGSSQILPIVLGENERAMGVASALQEAGFDVRAIRPPTVPEGTARLRVSVNGGLTEGLQDDFVQVLHSVMNPTAAAPGGRVDFRRP